jgi:predicted NAD/FAD-binding protein
VILSVGGEAQPFDAVVLACHSDQALKLLSDPSQAETEVLGGIRYQDNLMQLHADESVLPENPQAWACWNVHISESLAERCTVSYHMNTLQNLKAPLEFIVSLNSADRVDPNKVFLQRRYAHPVYTEETLAAQQRWSDISGKQHSYFCGAYWGWGFHEDGVSSALRVVEQLRRAV